MSGPSPRGVARVSQYEIPAKSANTKPRARFRSTRVPFGVGRTNAGRCLPKGQPEARCTGRQRLP